MTLIELLITILIISILAAAVLGVAAVAGETAREARTRNMIARIHTLLTEHYDSYKSRRVKVQKTVLDNINDPSRGYTAPQKGAYRAMARLFALREMMLMEIPDRWSDVLLESVPPASPSPTTPKLPIYLDVPGSTGRTELANVYLRQYRRIAAGTNKLTGQPNSPQEIIDNQGAECLYLVVMYATADGEARTLFPESNIGDTDGDGALEFLDGWGNPIGFLRWAPGFESEIQSNANFLGAVPTISAPNPTWVAAANRDHDPFDLFRLEPDAFRLLPLINSAGRDEELGIFLADSYVTWRPASAERAFPGYPRLTPYRPVADPASGVTAYLGTDDGTQTATDNIHNHLIDTR